MNQMSFTPHNDCTKNVNWKRVRFVTTSQDLYEYVTNWCSFSAERVQFLGRCVTAGMDQNQTTFFHLLKTIQFNRFST